MSRPDSPYTWLWKELARRFGAAVATDLYEAFLAQNRAYLRHARGSDLSPDAPPQRRDGRPRGTRKRTMKEHQ